jgi:hypothetical protein
MVCRLYRVDDETLARAADPPSAPPAKGLRRLRRREAPDALDVLEEATGEADRTDIDKAWHGLHTLLTGTPEPVDQPAGFLLGGVTLPCAYATVGAHRVEALPAILTALEETDLPVRLADVFDRETWQEEVYPHQWDDDDVAYLTWAYEECRTFVEDTVALGKHLVVAVDH